MIYTIGHSNHNIQTFIELLRKHDITALGDVRSHPYSRYATQYSKDAIKSALTDAGIAYVFLGDELGARSKNYACYEQGKVQYDRLAQEPSFAEGIKRIMRGMDRYRIVLMCAEKDPLVCHRALLVARKLCEKGVLISHIQANGSLERHQDMESRLLVACKLPAGDLFREREEFVAKAYSIQGDRVAYKDESMNKVKRIAAL
ncbi:MAG: DUF488 domain-containing protein [bacterium]|nr:DUF488 domain-containing protein [bacterium]